MKVLATFDGSALSESIIPQLRTLSALPGVEFILLRVGDLPHGHTTGEPNPPVAAKPAITAATPLVVNSTPPSTVETKEQAVERVRAEIADYLQGIANQLPPNVPSSTEAALGKDVKSSIVKFAMERKVDLIVMATHGRTGLVHVIFGDVAESVLRSGVAPVLLVPPNEVTHSRQAGGG
jgi:nucleotide-binding universal stress UspA family protein